MGRIVSETGMPKAKRGRGGKSLAEKFAEYDIDIEKEIDFLKKNLGQAVAFTDIPANLGYSARNTYGVDVGARKIDPENGTAAELWFEWPSYEDDNGKVVEDTEQVASNIKE